MAEIEVTTLPTPIPTPLNVTALAKRFGVARSTIPAQATQRLDAAGKGATQALQVRYT
jgi:hypothetical protein